MKPFSLALLFVTVGVAYGSTSVRIDPSPLGVQLKHIPIVRFIQDIKHGSDVVSFESGDGIKVHHNTELSGRGGAYDDGQGKMIKTDSSVVKTGSYGYTAPDGTPIEVHWVADENGFRATGDHLPVAQAAPEPKQHVQTEHSGRSTFQSHHQF